MNIKKDEIFIQVKGIGFYIPYSQENEAQSYQPCILGFLQS